MTKEAEKAQEEARASNTKIVRELSPFSSSQPSTTHEDGSRKPSTTDRRGMETSKFHTSCSREHAASLKCITENYEQKSMCQPFFNRYKKCKREEHEKILEQNAQGGKRSLF